MLWGMAKQHECSKLHRPCWSSITRLSRIEANQLGAVLFIMLFGHDAWRGPSLKPHQCFGLEEIDGWSESGYK